jgi:hypothetical protein
VQRIIGLKLEVEELAHVGLVGPAPLVVVHSGCEVGISQQRRDMIQDGPEQGVRGVAISPEIVVVQLLDQSQELGPVKPVRSFLRFDGGDHLRIDVGPGGGMRALSRL